MKKSFLHKIVKICLWAVGVMIALIIAGYYYLGSIVKGAIHQFLPPMTGTAVQVEQVDLSLLSGKIEIRGLEIGNPKGYSQKNIFELGQIQVHFQPKTLLSSKILIDSIVISDTKVSAELKNLAHLESNVGTIQNNINSYLAKESKPSTERSVKTSGQKSTAQSGKSVGIKKLQISGTEVALGIQGKKLIIALPDIQQKNIGTGKETVLFADALADILESISAETMQAVSKAASQLAVKSAENFQEILKNNGGDIEGAAKETLKSLKGLFK